MPPKLKSIPSLKQIVVKKIVESRSLFGKLYELEEDLFEPVPSDIIDSILEQYCLIPTASGIDVYGERAGSVGNEITANEVCMLITNSTTKLNLSKLRAYRYNIDHSLICDALGTRARDSLNELKLSRWMMSASSLAFITLLCRNIEVLDLSFGRVTDEHIDILSRNCPHLRHLNVQDEEQKITSDGLMKITQAAFQLESLIITGAIYPVESVLQLLIHQKRLTHLRICNLIEALYKYNQKLPNCPLMLTNLVLLDLGSKVDQFMPQSNIASVISNVTALEIDLNLFRKLLVKDPHNIFGLAQLSSLRELKLRETIGSPATHNITQLWNHLLSLPGFYNITFLQLESGLREVQFPDIGQQKQLNRLIVRNSKMIFPLPETGQSLDGDVNTVVVPQLPERLSELIISEVKHGLPNRDFKEALTKTKFLESLCLHFSPDCTPVGNSKDWIKCLEHVIPTLKKLHLSCSKTWKVDDELLDYILRSGCRLTDLQINHLVIDSEERQRWLDNVNSTYDIKFKLLE